MFTRELARARDEAEALFSQSPPPLQASTTPSVEQSEENLSFEDPAGAGVSRAYVTTRKAGVVGACGWIEIPAGGGVGCWGNALQRGGGVLHRPTPLESRTDPGHPRVDLVAGASFQCHTAKSRSFQGRSVSARRALHDRTEQEARGKVNGRFDRAGAMAYNAEGRQTTMSSVVTAIAREEGVREGCSGASGQGRSYDSGDKVCIYNPMSTGAAPSTLTASVRAAPTSDNDKALFDPPSIRNGLSGLSMQEVDQLLLRVETAIAGSKTVWRAPGDLERSQFWGKTTENASERSSLCPVPSSGDREVECESGKGVYGKMRRVIRTPNCAKGPPPNKKNR